jgi:hypothetical protein
VFKILTNLLPKKITILQVIICDELRKGNMLNSGNNDREQNWLLLSSRVREASPTVTLGCPTPRWGSIAFRNWSIIPIGWDAGPSQVSFPVNTQ